MFDLTPTTDRVRGLVRELDDVQLRRPTPIDQPVAGLLQHLLGLSLSFRDAAAKVDGPTTNTPPAPVTDPLPEDWRSQLDNRLDELALAWKAPEAWEGMTMAGGVQLPGEVGGLVALDEVLLHGWDLARSTGQPYEPTDAECQAVMPIVTPSEEVPDGSDREGLFGAVVEVSQDAPLFHRVLGLAGRDPEWRPEWVTHRM